jgi:hypothetical protein
MYVLKQYIFEREEYKLKKGREGGRISYYS